MHILSIFTLNTDESEIKCEGVSQSQKSENLPGSKIFHAKTFRIKRVNRDIFDIATNLRKTCQFHVFLGNVQIGEKEHKM